MLRLSAACVVLALVLAPAGARAEPLLISLEAAGQLSLGAPQSDRFGPGAAFGVGLYYPVFPALLLGARLRAGFLGDGAAPADKGLADPGLGTLETASLVLRARPLAGAEGVRRASGLFFDAAIGGGATGQLPRAAFEVGVGYGIDLEAFNFAPVLRFEQVLEPANALSGADARLLMLGAELTFGDARASAAVVEAPTEQAPDDLDHDGIPDASDACADQPEDHDGHDDADGCPEADNDGDKIPDTADRCPDDPEDFDEHDDADGCPDLDNDGDGFLDPEDQCPNEAEIVNGNKDHDGCPDEGLIELKNDRIVLEERVLFDSARARVKREARPILRAIVNLKAQHPEWIKLRIEGHADVQGDEKFNQDISERRADNVMNELIRLGIPASQIESIGYGSTRPRDKRNEEDANARNRRVEFVVMQRGVAAPGQTTVAPAPDADDGPEDDASEAEPAKPAAPVKPTTTPPAAAGAKP